MAEFWLLIGEIAMKYANYNATIGKILGFYDDSIHAEIPKPNIKLTDEEWLDCINNQGFRLIDVNSKTVVEFTPPPPTLEDLKMQAGTQVIGFATAARVSLTQNADPCKLAGYVDKARRAERVVDGQATEQDLSILQLECERRSLDETPVELAAKQHGKAQQLSVAVAIIDGLESAAEIAIEKAETPEVLEATLRELETSAQAELKALLDSLLRG